MEDVEEDVFRLSADDIELVQVDDESKDGEEDEEGKGPAEKQLGCTVCTAISLP